MNESAGLKSYNLVPDIVLFIVAGLLQFVVIYWCIPLLNRLGIMPIGSWMILSIPLIFFPIILGGLLILKGEKRTQKLTERLRLRKMTKKDWIWCLTGFIGMAAGSALAFWLCALLGLNSNPPFARNAEAWTGAHLWMFGLWIVYWPINILGEDLVWRGVILPRMEASIGKSAWLLNTFLWGLFHLAFGWGNLIVLVPTLFFVPYIAQKTRNTWTAVILHACLSGPGFIALAFGIMK